MSNEADQEKLLARWLSGELNEEEKAQLEEGSGMDDLRFAMDDIKGWQVPAMDTGAGLEDLTARLKNQAKPKQSKQVFFQTWIRIAASVVLIAAVYFVFNALLTSGPVTITAGFGETLSHVLPDGSRVDLDANSSITYSKKRWDRQRHLSMEGRALFSVQKGNTFRVDTEEGSVSVLGTIFEVKQRESGQLDVSCFEGLVSVSIAEQEELLKVGEGLQARNGQVKRLDVTAEIPSWVEKKNQYDETPLTTVLKDLSDFYGVEIELPEAKRDLTFTGELYYNSFDQAIENLANIFELSYSREGNKVVFE